MIRVIATCVALATMSLTTAAFAQSAVPPHIEQCIQAKAADLLFPPSKRAAWKNFLSNTDLTTMGRMTFGSRTWDSEHPIWREVAIEEIFEKIYERRRKSGSRAIAKITVESRKRPNFAHHSLLHVHVTVFYGDGDKKSVNLLGTNQCKLVNVGLDEHTWLSRLMRGTGGVIDNKAVKRRKSND